MESQPQNPEFSNNPEKFHPCNYDKCSKISNTFDFSVGYQKYLSE